MDGRNLETTQVVRLLRYYIITRVMKTNNLVQTLLTGNSHNDRMILYACLSLKKDVIKTFPVDPLKQRF